MPADLTFIGGSRLSVDDFALRRGHRYATLLIDAVTHRRIDVLPDRKASTLAAWLREHPEVEVVCRDGSAAYAEAIRDGAPQAAQVSDRWHLWHNLAKAVEKTVAEHSRCWHDTPVRPNQPLDQRTRERHAAVHALLDQGVGLLECARRLGWALNTVKRYARAATAEQLQRPPRYRETLVDPFRDHLRRRRADSGAGGVRDCSPGQAGELGVQAGLVGLDGQDPMGAALREVGDVVALAVQRVDGDHGVA